jgi:hypothetical protein
LETVVDSIVVPEKTEEVSRGEKIEIKESIIPKNIEKLNEEEQAKVFDKKIEVKMELATAADLKQVKEITEGLKDNDSKEEKESIDELISEREEEEAEAANPDHLFAKSHLFTLGFGSMTFGLEDDSAGVESSEFDPNVEGAQLQYSFYYKYFNAGFRLIPFSLAANSSDLQPSAQTHSPSENDTMLPAINIGGAYAFGKFRAGLKFMVVNSYDFTIANDFQSGGSNSNYETQYTMEFSPFILVNLEYAINNNWGAGFEYGNGSASLVSSGVAGIDNSQIGTAPDQVNIEGSVTFMAISAIYGL